MATLGQRISFLSRQSPAYIWMMLLRKLGKRRARHTRGGKSFIIPLDAPGTIPLLWPVEQWMPVLLKQLLPQHPGAFVDVGANVGQTLLWLRSVDDQRPWIGFEPSPDSCRALRALIAANELTHCTLIEAGLSDRAGEATLFAGGGTDSSATMIRDFSGKLASQQTLEMKVKLLNGADLAARELAAPVGILKVDVEGMELEVIRGLRGVIQRDKPAIIFEVMPVADDGSERATRMLARQRELTGLIKGLGYGLFRVQREGTQEELDAPRNDVDISSCNYVGLYQTSNSSTPSSSGR